MYYADGPGLYTDQINPFPFPGVTWPFLVEQGFEWATFQCYNPQLYAGVRDFDLAAVKAHGFKNVGVWGVIYSVDDFFKGGQQIGRQAVNLKAEHCIVNAEACMVGTRNDHAAVEIIRGIRDGGWQGSVDLSTYGAPWTPTFNDYAMDIDSFLRTGGTVISQDYFNDAECYDPAYGKLYWTRMGVRAEKINHCIALYSGARGRINGPQWVDILKSAGIGRNFSVYQVQDGMMEDYKALSAATKVPTVPVPETAEEVRAAMIAHAESWLEYQAAVINNPATKSRIRLAKRILQTTEAQRSIVDDPILTALNKAGVAQ